MEPKKKRTAVAETKQFQIMLKLADSEGVSEFLFFCSFTFISCNCQLKASGANIRRPRKADQRGRTFIPETSAGTTVCRNFKDCKNREREREIIV